MQQQVLWGERVMGAPHPFKVADLATLNGWPLAVRDRRGRTDQNTGIGP